MSVVLLVGALIATAIEKAEKFYEVCGVCHSEIAEDFVSHPHRENGLDCDSCHGESSRHRESEGGASPDRVPGGREIPTLCAACHQGEGPESIGKEFLESAHGRALASESRRRAPNCGTCHGVHRVRPPRGVERGCKECHDSLPSACAGPPRRSSPVSCAVCHEPHRFLADGR